jgi:hypothetical protein
MLKKGALVFSAVISFFISFIMLIVFLTGRKWAIIFLAIFGACFVYSVIQLKKIDAANAGGQAVPRSTANPSAPFGGTAPIGGIDYITSKGITPDMVYGLNTKYSSKDGFGSVYFPKNFGGLSFAKKFDAVKVCIITTERPNFRNIKLGENVLLVPEPTNPYDRNAIVILSKSQKLGYIYRNGIQDILNEKFRAGNIVVGSVVGKEAKSDYIKIDIVVYK